MEKMTTSEKVRNELFRRGMTQNELADKLGMTPQTMTGRIQSNTWKVSEVYMMKHKLGFEL